MTALTLCAALTCRPYPSHIAPGGLLADCMLLCVRDTTGLIEGSFVAQWKGPDAVAFCQQHAAELIPGRCIYLQFTRLRALNDELRADVLGCSLAPMPPSWTNKQTPPVAQATPAQAATKTIA